MDFLRTIDTDQCAGRRLRAAPCEQALDIGQILKQRRHARHGVSQHDARQPACGRSPRSSSSTPRRRRSGLNRQIFFCQLGGFDTHQGQVNTQANLLTQVSQAIKAFYEATVELGLGRIR